MGPLLILIDGYNVIRNVPGLAAAERCGLEAGRDALMRQVRARYRHTPHRVVIVFDGAGDTESIQALARMPRGQVVFTRRGDTADSAIQRRAEVERAAGGAVQVCSDDIEVRSGVSSVGGSALSVGELAETLNAPDRYQRRLHLTRQFQRRQWEDEGGADTSRHPRGYRDR
ncbi:MAG: NYN domain-containing protein [Ktedonobacterales bacterium]